MAYSAYTRIVGVWKRITNIYVRVGGVWEEIIEGQVQVLGPWKRFHTPVSKKTISVSTQNYDLFTDIGSPAGPVRVELVIDAGVIIGSSDVLNPAFTTGVGWHINSEIIITNNGRILGKGGFGARGGHQNCISGVASSIVYPGGDAGNAIQLEHPVSIDNTNGNIFGGGGGGGGGASRSYRDGGGNTDYIGMGGGGGGGAGDDGGALGPATNPGVNCGVFTIVWSCGNSGTAGTDLTNGVGGAACNMPFGPAPGNSWPGGNGGNFGEDGLAGGGIGFYGTNEGGTAGRAINLNGYPVTWEGGNTEARVKGDVI